MKNINIIRAWKDQAYRNSLTPEQRAALPENPAGGISLNEAQLAQIAGGVDVAASGVAVAIHWPQLSIFRDCSGKIDCCPKW